MYNPADEIDPQLVDQVDGMLAVNCCVAFSATVAALGVMVTAQVGTAQSSAHKERKPARMNQT